MTTPPVPQWAVDAAKAIYANFCTPECITDEPIVMEAILNDARIIAAHAPQGNEDGALLKPIAEFVRVNDSDTLNRMLGDETVVARTAGSWSGPACITLGDLRRIDAARKKDL